MKFYTAEKFTIIHTVFSKFQRIDPIQGEAWAIAIGQYNSDGTLRFPEDGEEICSKHFVNGNHEQYISSPSYAPTLSMPENSVTKIDNSMYNYGHLQVVFEDGSIGWYESGWGPMISETAFFAKDVFTSWKYSRAPVNGPPLRPKATLLIIGDRLLDKWAYTHIPMNDSRRCTKSSGSF